MLNNSDSLENWYSLKEKTGTYYRSKNMKQNPNYISFKFVNGYTYRYKETNSNILR